MPDAHTTMWRQIEALFAAENEPWPMHCVTTNSITALRSLVMRSDCVSISSHRMMKLEATPATSHACRCGSRTSPARSACASGAAPTLPRGQRFIAVLRTVGD